MTTREKNRRGTKDVVPVPAFQSIINGVASEEEEDRVAAATEIRRLTKYSSKNRKYLSNSIDPLVSMLRSGSTVCKQTALLALLNLAVKDQRNKQKIVKAGALAPIVDFLQSTDSTLQEHATATLLTLTAFYGNKPTISDSGAIPVLVKILRDGSPQSKIDAVSALHNLSTLPHNLNTILSLNPVSPIIILINSSKKSTKHVEKCTALVELLMGFEEGRDALTSEDGGVLAVVEVLEEGTPESREHAVGGLLTMCKSNRDKYREVILKEGAIPGLLELTVQGSAESQLKAQTLLQLLRDDPRPRSQLHGDHTLNDIVTNIVSRIDVDGEEGSEKAKKMLAEMVQVSMEQSWKHLQQRAGVM